MIGAVTAYRFERSNTDGPRIVFDKPGGGVFVVARGTDAQELERLCEQAADGALLSQAMAGGGAVLTPVEYSAMRRDVESYRKLEDDVAAGRKIVTDVPAAAE